MSSGNNLTGNVVTTYSSGNVDNNQTGSWTQTKGLGNTTGLVEVSRTVVGQTDTGYITGPVTTKESSW